MKQSKLHSLIESVCNIVIGYGVSVLANALVLPMWGFNISARDSMTIGLVFSMISVIRSFVLRRIFEAFR